MKLIFRPRTQSYQDILLATHAKVIWEEVQNKAIMALEQTSGLRFRQHAIHALSGKFNGTHSGWPRREAMSIPLEVVTDDGSSYMRSDVVFIGVVMHELGHHLLLEHGIIAPAGRQHHYMAHQHLYIFLWDAWEMALGHEKRLKLEEEEDNYEEAQSGWPVEVKRWAASLSPKQRHKLLDALRTHKRLPKRVMPKESPTGRSLLYGQGRHSMRHTS